MDMQRWALFPALASLSAPALCCLKQPNLSSQPRGKIPTVHFCDSQKNLMWLKNSLQEEESNILSGFKFPLKLRNGGFFLSILCFYLPNLSYCIHSSISSFSFTIFRLFFCFPLTAHACRHVWTVNNMLTKVHLLKKELGPFVRSKKVKKDKFYQVDKKKKRKKKL